MKLRIIIEQDEDGVFVAEVPALPGCKGDSAESVVGICKNDVNNGG